MPRAGPQHTDSRISGTSASVTRRGLLRVTASPTAPEISRTAAMSARAACSYASPAEGDFLAPAARVAQTARDRGRPHPTARRRPGGEVLAGARVPGSTAGADGAAAAARCQ